MSEGGETTPVPDAAAPGDAPAAAPVARRARYAHFLAHYPAHFQALLGLAELPVRERALKVWIAEGRDAKPPELPPFDAPRSLKDWWMRVKTNRPPDWVVALAALPVSALPAPTAAAVCDSASIAETPPPPSSIPVVLAADSSVGPLFAAAAAAPQPSTSSVPSAPPLAPPALVLPSSGVGFSAALQRLRNAEAAAGELYTSLLRQAAESTRTAEDRAALSNQAERERRSWDELGEKLRRYEKDAEKILGAAGRMWMADDVIAANDLVHLVLRRSIEGLLRRVRPKLSGRTPPEQDALWADEVESLFAGLRANKFTAPALAPASPTFPTLPSAPPTGGAPPTDVPPA